MGKSNLTVEEKNSYIDYMLNNEKLERIIQKCNMELPQDQVAVMSSILSRCVDGAGVIVAIDSDEIPVGVDNIELYTEITKYCKMHCAAKPDGTKYVMAFTSKDRFLDGLSGIVVPMDVFIGMICLKKEETNGVVINIKQEELIINMSALEILYNCIREWNPEPK